MGYHDAREIRTTAGPPDARSVANRQAAEATSEDDFLHRARIDPRTDGRPDSRPDVRENDPRPGDLQRDFDFSQRPAEPDPLPMHPAPQRG